MMTLSQPMAAFHGIQKRAPQTQPTKRPLFAGEAEYQEYLAKMKTFSDETVRHMGEVADKAKEPGPGHIALALGYGKKDPDVAWFNNLTRSTGNSKDLRDALDTVRKERKLDVQA